MCTVVFSHHMPTLHEVTKFFMKRRISLYDFDIYTFYGNIIEDFHLFITECWIISPYVFSNQAYFWWWQTNLRYYYSLISKSSRVYSFFLIQQCYNALCHCLSCVVIWISSHAFFEPWLQLVSPCHAASTFLLRKVIYCALALITSSDPIMAHLGHDDKCIFPPTSN